MEKYKNATIEHHNRITESVFNFTELEFNAFAAVIYKLQETKKSEATFNFKEIEGIVNSKDKSYNKFTKLIESLQSKPLKIETLSGIKQNYSIFTRSIFNLNDKTVDVKLSEEKLIDENKNPVKDRTGKEIIIKDLIINVFRGEFTRYKILEFSTLKSKYTKRIFQLCNQWKLNGITKNYQIDELYDLLNLRGEKKSLRQFKEFRRLILEPAKLDINQNTSLNIGEILTKEVKKVTHIKFFIEETEELKSQIDKKYPEEVEDLFDLLPTEEQLESKKETLKKYLIDHSFEYLKLDIKHINKIYKIGKVESYWGYLNKSVTEPDQEKRHYGEKKKKEKIENKYLGQEEIDFKKADEAMKKVKEDLRGKKLIK